MITHRWRKEAGSRIEGSNTLDSAKVQAPCIVRIPSGGYRLFYTAVGPGKPYPKCQGYILSATSDDGLIFSKEPGIRLAPKPLLRHISLRVLAPAVVPCSNGTWRMYFEARGAARYPTVICSAVSSDMLNWEIEDGIRLQSLSDVGGPRYLPLADGRGRIYYCSSEVGGSGNLTSKKVISAVTSDGLNFEFERYHHLSCVNNHYDTAGITASQAIPPTSTIGDWTMVFSAWQDVSPGTVVPPHPSRDIDAFDNGDIEDFAALSIASDIAGYRSRIFVAHSNDGKTWGRGKCAIDGGGYRSNDFDAVHAEDMSVINVAEGMYRMYYAACDRYGNWRIASAATDTNLT